MTVTLASVTGTAVPAGASTTSTAGRPAVSPTVTVTVRPRAVNVRVVAPASPGAAVW